ncbi:hypothetical protein AN651_09105, partial [Xanthomonas arboricola]
MRAGRHEAAVDVFEREPVLDPRDPLLQHPRVLATPHLGYVESDSYALYFEAAFDNVLAFAAGAPRNLVKQNVVAIVGAVHRQAGVAVGRRRRSARRARTCGRRSAPGAGRPAGRSAT